MVDPYPRAGELLDGKYLIGELLGAGGMGVIVKATQRALDRPVAIKFMAPHFAQHAEFVERFRTEGLAATRARGSSHIVGVLDVGTLPHGSPYLVMEYLEGEDLARLLASEGNPWLEDTGRVIHFLLQILAGLQAAHEAGIIHRDLKPANCFRINHDGDPDFIKILDFGISKISLLDSTQTRTGAAMGTPAYAAPEQLMGTRRVDARADIYGACVIAYELLCGRTPRHVDPDAQAARSLDSLRSDLPAGLSKAIARGLAWSPEDRYASASAMAARLEPFADTRSAGLLPAALVGGSASTPGPRPLVSAAEDSPATLIAGPASAEPGPAEPLAAQAEAAVAPEASTSRLAPEHSGPVPTSQPRTTRLAPRWAWSAVGLAAAGTLSALRLTQESNLTEHRSESISPASGERKPESSPAPQHPTPATTEPPRPHTPSPSRSRLEERVDGGLATGAASPTEPPAPTKARPGRRSKTGPSKSNNPIRKSVLQQ